MAKKSSRPIQTPQRTGSGQPGTELLLDVELRGEIERQIGPLIQGNSNQREAVVSRVVSLVVEETFKGPIPHPRHFQSYEAILPGSADRLLRMAEKTNDHNLAVMAKEQQADHNYRNLGMWLGFGALLSLIGAAVYCGLHGQPELAGGFIAVGVLGVVGRFIQGHYFKDVP